jgi:hypothetical protein
MPTEFQREYLLRLPLAQLYRRAHNAKTPLARHLTALSLWEASLKLLTCVAVIEYAARGPRQPDLVERLRNLARPSLGPAWEFARRLVPVLAEEGDPGFGNVRELLLGRPRHDCTGRLGWTERCRVLGGEKVGRGSPSG